MRNLLLFIIVIIALNSCSQKEQKETNQHIAATVKIWGFLKYYHPEVGKGKLNWDQQLIGVLPKIKKAKNKEELSTIYLEWINSLGEIEICKSCDTAKNKDYFGKNFDLNWLQDSSQFSSELISKLLFIEKNRFQGNHHYIKATEYTGNVEFKNEIEYSEFNWKNNELRILSLCRYWNYIEYFFPYKYQMDKDWDIVLEESISNFINPKNETEFHLAMLELIASINDSHGYLQTHILTKYFGRKWIPAEVKIIDNKAVVVELYNTILAEKNDIQIGDAITKIEGKRINTIINENNKFYCASNNSVKLREASQTICKGSSDSVMIEFERGGVILEKTIERYWDYELNYKPIIAKKWELLENNIGYVNMGSLQLNDVKTAMQQLFNTNGIIFDIRNYPKGTYLEISKYLNEIPKEFVKFIEPDLSYPGKFIWNDTLYAGIINKNTYKGKVILLVNETTQSHAEFTAMCLHTAGKSMVIGSQTSGADGNISFVKMVGGFKTTFTGLGVFYPDGRETQRIGIVPDIEVKPTIEGIRKGKDEVLEAAILIANE